MYIGDCLHIGLYITLISGALRDQKRESDPLEWELQTVVSCYVKCKELTLGPLEEQPVILTIEPISLAILICITLMAKDIEHSSSSFY